MTRTPGTILRVQPDRIEARIGHSSDPRNCDECSAPIQRGDKFERIHGTWHGVARTFKVCLACAGILWWRGHRHDRDPEGATIGVPGPLPHGSDTIQRMVPWDALQEARS